MDDELKIKIFTAKILQFCADIFAVFGVILFVYLYFHSYSSAPTDAFRDPFFVVTILIPFIPAAVLAWQAARKRRQIRALLEQMGK